MQQVRALAVDDSAIYRRVVSQALQGVAGVQLVGTAAHGKEALAVVQKQAVDLITLDLEMPEMDGVSTLKALRAAHFTGKVIVLSAMSRAGADSTIRAMAAGADDFLLKPKAQADAAQPQSAAELVRAHLLPKVQQFWSWLGSAPSAAPLGSSATPGHLAAGAPTAALAAARTATAAPVAAAAAPLAAFWPKVVLIASSTGGPAALEGLLKHLAPLPSCPIVVAQHMPALFTASLAKHLSEMLKLPVAEVQDNQRIVAGGIYIAPGDFHLRLVRHADHSVCVQLDQGERRNFVRPSADYLFESAAQIYGRHSLGMVLTGMGSDGRDGALAVKRAGGRVLIQNKASCAVFGMPKAVQDAGAADLEADLPGLAAVVQEYVRKVN